LDAAFEENQGVTAMKTEHAEWIERYLDRCGRNPRGRCSSATAEMIVVFPELTRVPGVIYYDGGWSSEHFWCVDYDGDIVDPTAAQFKNITHYAPWQPGDEVQVGRCMNCGVAIYEAVFALGGDIRRDHCSRECLEELLREFNANIDKQPREDGTNADA